MLYKYHLLLLALISVAWPAQAAAPNGPSGVEPVVLLKNGNIRACGVRATFHSGEAPRTFELLVRRSGDNTLLELRANCGDHSGRPGRPVLQTRTINTDDLLKGNVGLSQGRSVLSAPASNDKVAVLIQEYMIGGGKLQCLEATDAGFTVNGPLPNQTRAAYLNCAGDLFRPEEER